jgi:flagellar protein FliO/FliZ
VAVLKLMDRALVLGVTEQGVQLLTETELAPIEQVLTVPAASRRRPAEPIEPDGEPAVDSRLPALPAFTGKSKLDGSVLSPNTWKQLLGAARELTVRR